ncbi:glycosyltransferase [Berryella intestinalis]|uniref:glycosyltransferase n=1 Tax=Berryella intestinalis TaxID=1531429 RepID=UPI00069080C4|nr:glycosyltransferase [Berryella intestinalis]
MNIFVASWFFPPSVSSEGIVTYKLFRNSAHHYDVCSSQSTLWSYDQVLPIDADNIASFPIDTDDFDTWIDAAVELFEQRHAQSPYDAIMTRSMPPESVEVAKRIKEKHPDLPWIASLADPIAKSPYHIKGWVLENQALSKQDKADFQVALKAGCEAWKDHESEGIRTMCELKDVEDYAIHHADALIFPHETLQHFVLGTRRRKNNLVVPHSFDTALYPQPRERKGDGVIELAFLGHSDHVRSLEPLVRAMQRLKTLDADALGKLRLRFIGNVTEEVRSLVYNYDLYDCIRIESSVDYQTSLRIMGEVDWLLHIDAHFDILEETGGSIYFAGKIADYLGTDTPIFAVTGEHTPACEIVRHAGGLCFTQDDVSGIAAALSDIAQGRIQASVDRAWRDRYDARAVAAEYDRALERVVSKDAAPFERSWWPEVEGAGTRTDKLLTVCVPAYNVECFLDRCLHSFMSSPAADALDIIVVNDGSPDNGRAIAEAYCKRYPSIVSLIDKENGGHGSTINAALERARGLYFRVVDGDDWVDGKNLAAMLSKVESLGEYADLVSTNYHQVYGEDGHTVPWMKVSGVENYRIFDFASSDFTMEYFTMASTMVKTEILRKANFKIQEKTFYVDVEYILFPIPYVETVMFTPEFVYRYAVGNADQSINRDVFTARYDHHDRVIRRMLSYYRSHKPAMSQGQRAYTESLFVRHLLNSHYTLSLIWDTDKERGCARARDFDAFLKQTDPDLHSRVGAKFLTVRALRKCDFDPRSARLYTDLGEDTLINSLRRAARAIATTPVGEKIAYNPVTAAISNRFFRR